MSSPGSMSQDPVVDMASTSDLDAPTIGNPWHADV